MCQEFPKEKWIDAQKENVLDAPYYHVVFTVPEELNPIIYSNQKLLYDALYHAASSTLNELAKDSKYLGADIGYICILHTWGSAMNYHPHIHTIVLGGGLDKDSKWKDTGGKFFLPYGVIAKVFREKYTHRIAISNHRIKSMTEATVTYAVKDYKNKGQWKEKTVPGEEFIRRFLMHVPPKRFVRIRHYGLLSCRNKSKKMAHCRNLLGCKKYISALKNRSATEMIKLLYNIDVCRCSSCGGKMVPHLPDKHTPSVLAHMRC